MGTGWSSRYCLRICSRTAGSRSSPAMTSAGSPGNSCCREKMITDTKNSVGINCSRRLPRKSSIGDRQENDPVRRSRFEPDPYDTHQAIRELLVAFQTIRMGDDDEAVV